MQTDVDDPFCSRVQGFGCDAVRNVASKEPNHLNPAIFDCDTIMLAGFKDLEEARDTKIGAVTFCQARNPKCKGFQNASTLALSTNCCKVHNWWASDEAAKLIGGAPEQGV